LSHSQANEYKYIIIIDPSIDCRDLKICSFRTVHFYCQDETHITIQEKQQRHELTASTF